MWAREDVNHSSAPANENINKEHHWWQRICFFFQGRINWGATFVLEIYPFNLRRAAGRRL